MPIEVVVADDEWQEVRKSLVGHWVRNHNHNIDALRAYLDRKGWDDPLAVRRVLNVMVGSVHRCRHTAGQPETDQLRLEIRTTWHMMLGLPTEGLVGDISGWKGTFA